MKFQRMKKTLAVFLSVAVVGGAAAISAGAEEAAYTPNRSITISNEAAAASLKMTALPDHLGAGETVNGPYHLWAMMKIDGMTAIDNGAEASVALTAKYGYYTAGSDDLQYKTVELGKWTADTDGWVEMTTAAGPHFVLEAIDPSGEDDVYGDVTIEFAMNNAGGDFSFADLVIADKENQIVYSLANDLLLRHYRFFPQNEQRFKLFVDAFGRPDENFRNGCYCRREELHPESRADDGYPRKCGRGNLRLSGKLWLSASGCFSSESRGWSVHASRYGKGRKLCSQFFQAERRRGNPRKQSCFSNGQSL